MRLKTFTAGALAAGSLSTVLAAPVDRVHTPCPSSTGVVDAIFSKLPIATQSQQAVDRPLETPDAFTHTRYIITTITTHTPCSSSTPTATAEALNVPRQAVDWATVPTPAVDPQLAPPPAETAWLAPSSPAASPTAQPTPALNAPVPAPSAPVATASPPQTNQTYTYEETHRPAPDSFGPIATIVTLSVLGAVVLVVISWAIWSHRRGGKPFACFGSCCGARKPRHLDEENTAPAGAGRHYSHLPVVGEAEETEMVTVQQQWPGRGRRSNEYVPAAPVVVEKELPRVPEEMVYQARGQQARLEPDWARGF